jgi:hypothetical protein
MKLNKTIFGIIISILLLLGICVIVRFVSISQQDSLLRASTSPLPLETIDILCNNFEIDENHKLCDGEKDIYSWDFSDIFQDSLLPKEGNPATYEEVERTLGVFKYECEPVVHQADGLSYFRCSYDLIGDRIHHISIYFSHPEDIIFRVYFDFDIEGDDD